MGIGVIPVHAACAAFLVYLTFVIILASRDRFSGQKRDGDDAVTRLRKWRENSAFAATFVRGPFRYTESA